MSLKLIDEMTIGVTNISNNVTFYRIEGPLSFSLDICWYLNDQLVTVDRFVRLDSKTVVCLAKTEQTTSKMNQLKDCCAKLAT